MHGRIALALFIGITNVAAAQSTNLSIFQDLAVACLGEVPAQYDSLFLAGPERMPYLRSALIDHWRDTGRAIFLPESNTSERLPTLSFIVDNADVEYARAGRRMLTRRVSLGLRYTLTDASSQVVADQICLDHVSDTIEWNEVPLVENQAFDETQGELPRAGWIRRFLEPAILTGATAIAVYLFFVLRSERTSDS